VSTAALVAAGEVLRRGGDAKAALAALGIDEAAEFLAALDVDLESRRLARACDAALECAIAETDEERVAHAAAAIEALTARDRIESALAALAQIALTNDVRARFEAARDAVARLDRAARAGVAALVAVNDARRRERDRLAAEHRGRAWWWSARAECDAFVAVLRGSEMDASHACDECARDRASAKIADAPPLRHLSADELWSWDVGAMSKDERRRVERHVARCADCKRAIDALADAERAIDESETSSADDVAAEHAAFVVRVRRDAKRARFVVEPRDGAKLKSATMPGAAKARRTPRGLELGIAASAARSGLVLVVEVAANGAEAVRVEVKLDLAR